MTRNPEANTSMSTEKSLLKASIESLQLWLCLAVYVWLLEFQAVIGLDQEPFFDRLMDCAAVLLTLSFWAATAGLTLVALSVPLRIAEPAFISRFLCRGTTVVATAYYFFRWLDNWSLSETHREIITAILFLSCLCLGAWLLLYRRREKIKVSTSLKLPPLS